MLIVLREISEKRGIQQQGMIPVALDVFLLQADSGIVIVEEHNVARLEERHRLPVYARRVEEERCSRWPVHHRDLRLRHLRQLSGANPPRMLPPVGPFDVVDRPATNVRQEEPELHFPWDGVGSRLLVPLVAVPAMEIACGWQGPPPAGLHQGEPAQVPLQDSLDQRVERNIHKSLLEGQDVLDHVPVELGFLVSVHIAPAQQFQPRVECALHRGQLFRREEVRQADHPVLLEAGKNLLDGRQARSSLVGDDGLN